jgi:Flp pilus assembly protein TadB
MYGNPLVFVFVILIGGIYGLFTVIAIFDGSLARLGISAAALPAAMVAKWVVDVLRRKRMNREIEELEQGKYE